MDNSVTCYRTEASKRDMGRKVLVLNQDYSAFSICSVPKAFLLVFLDKAELVAECDNLSDFEEEDKKWFSEHLTKENYDSAEDVMKDLGLVEVQSK